MRDCPICRGLLWVCESHPNLTWDDSDGGCECSAGMACECNPTGALGPSVVEIIADVQMPEPTPTRTLHRLTGQATPNPPSSMN